MLKKRLLKPISNNRGVALLMAIFAVTIMLFLAVEVSYDTSVEYLVASQQVNRLRAYYAARAGMEISLLRVVIYKKALAQYGPNLKGQESLLDPIWQMPFTWPPVLPDDLSNVDRQMIGEAVEASNMDSQYLATIESEGGKIDINDLGSETKSLREATRKQILTLFETQMRNNEEFADQWYSFNFEELLNNITDWIDANEESLNGGAESGYYSEISSDFIPPNSPLKTVEELHMVAGMKDGIYAILAPRVTVYGVKGVNVNYANKEVLLGLAPTMTEEAANAVVARRNNPDEGGPFTGEDDFFGFLQSYNVDVAPIKESELPLYFGTVYNFRIRSTGQFANVSREIEAIVYDLENLTDRYINIIDKAKVAEGETLTSKGPVGADGNVPDGGDEQKFKAPKGRPTIVYWKEN